MSIRNKEYCGHIKTWFWSTKKVLRTMSFQAYTVWKWVSQIMKYICMTLRHNNVNIMISTCFMKQKRTAESMHFTIFIPYALFKHHAKSRYISQHILRKLYWVYGHNLFKFKGFFCLCVLSFWNIIYKIVYVKQKQMKNFYKIYRIRYGFCSVNSFHMK